LSHVAVGLLVALLPVDLLCWLDAPGAPTAAGLWCYSVLALGAVWPVAIVCDRLAERGHRLAARRRMSRGLCAACGYPLTGNVSGVCPECGTPVPH
jgi:hypothetical protein